MDETDKGWLKPFYCHNTLPEPDINALIFSFFLFCSIHIWLYRNNIHFLNPSEDDATGSFILPFAIIHQMAIT